MSDVKQDPKYQNLTYRKLYNIAQSHFIKPAFWHGSKAFPIIHPTITKEDYNKLSVIWEYKNMIQLTTKLTIEYENVIVDSLLYDFKSSSIILEDKYNTYSHNGDERFMLIYDSFYQFVNLYRMEQ